MLCDSSGQRFLEVTDECAEPGASVDEWDELGRLEDVVCLLRLHGVRLVLLLRRCVPILSRLIGLLIRKCLLMALSLALRCAGL